MASKVHKRDKELIRNTFDISVINRTKSLPDRPLTYDELSPLSDEALMSHLKNGHHDALAVLFDRYHRLVLNIALRILRDPGEAEDLNQSVFVEILRSAAQFDQEKGTTKVWILQYAYHRAFNRKRDLTLRGYYGNRQECSTELDSESNNRPVRGLGAFESARMIEQALPKLNEKQRKTVELVFFEGLTMHEIAERTGESFDAVRHHYYRALEKLRLILREVPRTRIEPAVGKDCAHVRP
jgi:RNA polymerase sigma-70 factor (ECF subfamily)